MLDDLDAFGDPARAALSAGGFTPASAERYARESLPTLFQTASAHLGEPGADGTTLAAISPHAARAALLAAAEILEVLGPHLSADLRVPAEAAWARLIALFTARHPQISLDLKAETQAHLLPRGPVASLDAVIADAWTDLERS